MDPVQAANLAFIALQAAAQLYTQIQQAHNDKLKPLGDILAAGNVINDDGIAVSQAEIDKLIRH